MPKPYTLNVDRCNKENGFILKKKKTSSRQYPADVNYTNDLVLLVNTLAQTEFLLYSLGQAAGGIDLYVNSKTSSILNGEEPSSLSVVNL